MFTIQGSCAKAAVMIDGIDQETHKQILSFCCDTSFGNPIIIMPDCHKGEGTVIGFTMPLEERGRVIPNIVGVDQSCGMLAARYYRPQIERESADVLIRKHIPMGPRVHGSPALHMEDFPWQSLRHRARLFSDAYYKKFGVRYDYPDYNHYWYDAFCDRIGIDSRYAECSIGTLGGGNHFIEFGTDETGGHWVTIHSGSRNLGKRAADYWSKRAISRTKRWEETSLQQTIDQIKATRPKNEWQTMIDWSRRTFRPGTGLDYLEREEGLGYLFDALFCNQYAHESRREMLRILDSILQLGIEHTIETVHNYIDPRDLIIRKGAVASYKDEEFILPFNMEDGLLICKGKSNKDWNFSAPHGAGRIYSRSDAKKYLSVDEAKASMKSKDIFISALPIDEARGAYKPAEVIEAAIEPTAEIIHRVKPQFVLKAGG